MDRNLALEFVRVTEAAALAVGRWIGRGNEKAADHAAVESMRKAFDSIRFEGTIKIGEGERDEAPMLFIGEKVGGVSGPKIDIACDPLEGTTITALGRSEALSVIAAAEEGNFLHAPDTYMDKIAVGPLAKGAIDITKSPSWNGGSNLFSAKRSTGSLIFPKSVVLIFVAWFSMSGTASRFIS